MAASTEYVLKYLFDIPDIRELKPGDIVSSSCPPTDTLHNGRSAIFSPGGFPLHFSLRLVYAKHYRDWLGICHQLELQLRLEEPSGVPFLPPLHIQPIAVPRDKDSLDHYLHPRHVGLQQPGIWGLTYDSPETEEDPPEEDSLEGEFWFQLLSEPLDLLAALPAPSSADWNILPGEMMSAVLRELPLADRVSARLVCHAWKRILDTDSSAWSNVSHLQCIGTKIIPEERYGYHEGQLNQVRVHKLCEALGFVASRKAPIHSLELNHSSSAESYQGLKHLPLELSRRHIKLKALLLRRPDYGINDKALVVKLIQSQPSLERLYLEAYVFDKATPIMNPAFARLRILSLSLPNIMWVQACLPHLTSLDGLRVTLPWDELTHGFGNLSWHVESQGMGLRRAKGVNWVPQGCVVMVWGTGNLSPSAAAFLLLPPPRPGFHHHI